MECCSTCHASLEEVEEMIKELGRWRQCRSKNCTCHSKPMEEKEWEKVFDREFMAVGAEIEGFKRQEYRQLRTHQYEQVKDFTRNLLTTQKQLLIKKVEGLRLMKDAMQGDIPSAYKSYNQALHDVLEALTNE